MRAYADELLRACRLEPLVAHRRETPPCPAPADFSRVPTLDLLEEVHGKLGFRLSLAHLAETTLGVSKAADGLQSLQWVRDGRWDLVGRRVRIPVSWS